MTCFRPALLFGVPVTRERFVAAAPPSGGSDYVALQVGQNPAGQVWDRSPEYERARQTAEELSAAVVESGGSVFYDATLHDIRAATRAHEVVIICTHWKGAALGRRDLRPPAMDLLDHIRASPHPVAEILRSRLARRTGILPWSERRGERFADVRCEGEAARELVSFLNEAIGDHALLALAKAMHPSERRDLGAAVTRDLLVGAFPENILPGNRLELADGLHWPGDIEAFIAPDFGGELDLSACESVVLARFIAECRGDRLLILHNRRKLDPLPRYRTLLASLEYARKEGCSYHAARFAVEHALLHVGRRVTEKREKGIFQWR